jgi:hypothetical protein
VAPTLNCRPKAGGIKRQPSSERRLSEEGLAQLGVGLSLISAGGYTDILRDAMAIEQQEGALFW